MADLATNTRSAVAQAAGTKAHPTTLNRVREVVIDSAAAYAAPANGDTFGTAVVIPAGSRILCPVTLSNGANAASVTLAFGIRDALTKVAIDATAILAATSVAAAATAQANTGTKLVNGQFYVMPSDVEIYGTWGGATPNANGAFRLELSFVSP